MADDEKPGCFDGVNLYSPSVRLKPPQDPRLPEGWHAGWRYSSDNPHCDYVERYDPETFAKWAAECDGRPKRP